MASSRSTSSAIDIDEARNLVNEVNAEGGTYHRLDLGDGFIIDGDYDMTKYLQYYAIPDNLSGYTVLDVGTASGFFAIECERRGAEVTAIDIWGSDSLAARIAETFKFGFEYISKDLYQLDASFGQYDLVVCGSVLLHLPDPVGALRSLRSVTGDKLVVSSAATPDSATTAEPVCHFFGERAVEADYWSYWGFSACGLERMLKAAGFREVDGVQHFVLESEPGRMHFETPHISVSART